MITSGNVVDVVDVRMGVDAGVIIGVEYWHDVRCGTGVITVYVHGFESGVDVAVNFDVYILDLPVSQCQCGFASGCRSR